NGEVKTVVLENKHLSISFSTKGGYAVRAQLKDYKTYEGKPLYLFNGDGNELSALLPINNNSVSTADLFYQAVEKQETNGDKTIEFTADLGNNQSVLLAYTLPADGYMMNCHISMNGMKANELPLTWQTQALHTEHEVQTERMNS